MLNKVTVMGRLVKDPELRGNNIVTGTIAVERNFINKQGSRDTDFFDVSSFGKTADFLSRYFEKGDRCIIDGELRQNKYTDKDGNSRSQVNIVAQSVYFVDAKKKPDTSPTATEIDSRYPIEGNDLPF